MPDDTSDKAARILVHQKQESDSLLEANRSQAEDADKAIADVQELLKRLDAPVPSRTSGPRPVSALPHLRSWDEILNEAQLGTSDDVPLMMLVSEDEIKKVTLRHAALEAEFRATNSLDGVDWAIAGVAGLLGALIDIFLVKIPPRAGLLGSAPVEGGWLSRLVRDGFGKVLPDEQIARLEQLYRVPFDAATSAGLGENVAGLGPRSHRIQSFGHDPILGWIVGVRDLLYGELTAIDKHGKLIVQEVADPFMAGESVFLRIFEALQRVVGHHVSDVATPGGLPPPLMPLLQFLQKGSIGKRGYTIGHVVRQMYALGYDFRHFIAGAIPVMIIEAIVRIAYFAREAHRGSSLVEAVPMANHPRLRTQLFAAHAIATATNAGKVYVMKTPLAINLAQWMALARYLIPQLHWLLISKEQARSKHIQLDIEAGWERLDDELLACWQDEPEERALAVLE